MDRSHIRKFWETRDSWFDGKYDLTTLSGLFSRSALQRREAAVLGEVRRPGVERILDVGCGTGRQLQAALETGIREAVGIDISETMIAAAEQRLEAAGLLDKSHLIRADVLEAEPPGGSFDLVYALGVFDYLADPRPLLKRMGAWSRCRVLLTFRRLWAVRSPFRKLRYQLAGCPIYLYTAGAMHGHLTAAGITEIEIRAPTAGMYLATGVVAPDDAGREIRCPSQ